MTKFMSLASRQIQHRLARKWPNQRCPIRKSGLATGAVCDSNAAGYRPRFNLMEVCHAPHISLYMKFGAHDGAKDVRNIEFY
jgi:hypothetical protein